MSRSYANYLYRVGGLATGGQGLGLMVAPLASLPRCPPGWIFLQHGVATVDEIDAALVQLRDGRKAWPKGAESAGRGT
jgi:hypothetical protein